VQENIVDNINSKGSILTIKFVHNEFFLGYLLDNYSSILLTKFNLIKLVLIRFNKSYQQNNHLRIHLTLSPSVYSMRYLFSTS